jgi:DNA-binding MarR family transcriptional regulator
VYLTEKGRAAQGQVEKIFCMIDDQCFDGFSETEKSLTIDILERLYNNLAGKGKGND